jgi:glycosyltransferase involved in cell wall biosynthesis
MHLPKLSVVVPNYNGGTYIEETLLSVIDQNYPNLELIVIDGGSSDNSVEVIKKYEKHISYWISEKDEGQSHAINKGFERASGDYIAWMNSDDLYLKDALLKVFSLPGITGYDFIYGQVYIGRDVEHVQYIPAKHNREFSLFNLLHFFYSVDYIIPSQSVFVKRSFLELHKIKFLNNACHYCMDMEWYCRIVLAKPVYYKYNEALSFFRLNESTKTGSQYSRMQAEAIQVFLNYRSQLQPKEEDKLFKLIYYHRVLHRLFMKKLKTNLKLLVRIFLETPGYAIKDRRFLGLVKRNLF